MKVAVFDFDCTLAVEDIGMQHSPENMAEVAFGGAERISKIRSMLQTLVDHGVTLAIVSYNRRDVIERALSVVGLLTFFEKFVLGREDVQYDRQWRKSVAITRHVLEPLGCVTPSSAADALALLFVDDDPMNIKDVRTAFPTSMTVWVRDRKGITEKECTVVLQWGHASDLAESAVSRTMRDRDGDNNTKIVSPFSTVDSAAAAEIPLVDQGACVLFVPSRVVGPLSQYCVHCARHKTHHILPDPVNDSLAV